MEFLEELKSFVVSQESRLFGLVKLCNQAEAKAVKNILHDRGNTSLSALFNFLLKCISQSTDEPSREVVYQKIYKKKYSPDNDYVLRNDYRLLCSVIEQVIKQKIRTDEVEAQIDYAYLQKIFTAMNWPLFMNEFKVVAARYKHMPDFSQKLMVLLQTASQYFVHHEQNNYKLLYNMAAQNMFSLRRQSAAAILKQAPYLGWLSKGIDNNVTPDSLTHFLCFDDVLQHDPAVMFYQLKYQQYFYRGQQLVSICLHALNILEEHPDKITGYAYEKIWCLGTIALEYSLMDHVAESKKYYALVLAEPEFKNSPILFQLLGNYMHVLIKSGDYAMVTQIYHEYEDFFEKAPKMQCSTVSLMAVALLFSEKLKDARRLLARYESLLLTADWDYLRLVRVLLYIAEEDMVAADTEIKNMKRVKKMMDEEEYEHTRKFLPVLTEYLRFCEEYNSLRTKANSHTVVQYIDQFRSEPDVYRYYSILILYMEKRIQTLLR